MNLAKPGWGFSAGTFGELVQGEIDATPFLMTLPIQWGTRATFMGTGNDSLLDVWPSHRKKALRAAEVALKAWHKPVGGMLVIQSTLPIGKGMASSSADIIATFRAVAAFYNQRLYPSQMANWAAQIEPSDGIMYPGVVALNPLTGQLLERFGPMPPAVIVGVLGHGRINTEDHHRHRNPYLDRHQDMLKKAIKSAREGIGTRNVTLIGEAGRISAEVECARHPDQCLVDILAIAKEESAGVIIAHSGTVRGLLLPSPQPGHVMRRLEQRLWALDAGPVYRLHLGSTSLGPLWGKGVWSGERVENPTPDSLLH